jgi:hypothetical protein
MNEFLNQVKYQISGMEAIIEIAITYEWYAFFEGMMVKIYSA